MDASIIIVTRDRAGDLKPTLESMRQVRIPDGLRVEMMVVDNGSSDSTRHVVENLRIKGIDVRYVCEERPGLSQGRNRGLRESKGGVILFTDDDIRPPASWLVEMIEPLVQGRAEAVCGGVRIAPELLRPWMTGMHRSWLASTEWLDSETPCNMVGANMGFSREVLRQVPCFDTELGAGALGSGEEVLFSRQLVRAGYRIHNCLTTCVEHHFQTSRLCRASWLDAASKMGASQAYVGHHWDHWGCRFGRMRLARATVELGAWRASNSASMGEEGCSQDELKLVLQQALVRAHLKESRRSRSYERNGLAKIGFLQPS